METLGMTSEQLNGLVGALRITQSRRVVLAALLAAVVPARVTAEQRCRARDNEDEILGFHRRGGDRVRAI